MKIIKEISSLTKFEPWSGAVDTFKRIVECDKEEEFISILEDIYPDGMTDGQLNDILWFDSEWCYELLGISSDDEEDAEDEEEEEDEE